MPHKLGQVFLTDRNILQKIIKAADLSPDDYVVEIGCGEGILTCALAERVKHVFVIEIDRSCIDATQNAACHLSNITYIHSDVLEFDFASLNQPSLRIVANIPYYISAKIVKKIIEYRSIIHSALVMTQKEFAEKLVAEPGQASYTSLGVYASYFLDRLICFNVSKTCFKPVPEVDSSIIKLIPLEDKEEIPELFNLVRTGFWGRRKPYLSALKKGPYLSFKSSQLNELEFFKKRPGVRAETLSLTSFIELYEEMKGLGLL